MAFINDCLYRKKIVIDHTQILEDLTEFPFIVSFTDTEMIGKFETDGADLLFTGLTDVVYGFEILSCDNTTGQVEAKVKI